MSDRLNKALHQAIEQDDPVKVKQLLEAGADVNAPNKHGWTPLLCICEMGNALVAQVLLEHGAKLYAPAQWSISEEESRIYAHPTKGASALRIAALQGHAEDVRVLLGWEADPEERQWALRASMVENGGKVRPILLEAGAKLGLVEYAMLGNVAKVEELLENPDRAFGVQEDAATALWLTGWSSAGKSSDRHDVLGYLRQWLEENGPKC